jgi:hypothetical protein
MNAIEIEEAVTVLSETPFDRNEFPYAFLMAFGNKETTIKRLRSGTSNKSDVGGSTETETMGIDRIAARMDGNSRHKAQLLPCLPRLFSRHPMPVARHMRSV